MMKKTCMLLIVLCAAVLCLAACQPQPVQKPPVTQTGQTDTSQIPGQPPGPPTSEPIATNAVKIVNYKFEPQVIQVSAGTKVTWTNMDADTHSINSRDGLFDSPYMDQNAAFSYTFDKAGTYYYMDKLHFDLNPGPYLGTVIVK
jgi:plastocyanin